MGVRLTRERCWWVCDAGVMRAINVGEAMLAISPSDAPARENGIESSPVIPPLDDAGGDQSWCSKFNACTLPEGEKGRTAYSSRRREIGMSVKAEGRGRRRRTQYPRGRVNLETYLISDSRTSAKSAACV